MASKQNILNLNQLVSNPDWIKQFRIGEAQKNPKNGQITRPWIFTDAKGDKYERILIKTGTLRTPFGTSSKVFDEAKGPQHTLQPANDPDNQDAANLFTFIQGLDKLCKDTALAAGNWWAVDKKPPSAETVQDRFRSIIKFPEEDKVSLAAQLIGLRRDCQGQAQKQPQPGDYHALLQHQEPAHRSL